jgi:RNA polymerase sigma factor (sigma-70 family)
MEADEMGENGGGDDPWIGSLHDLYLREYLPMLRLAVMVVGSTSRAEDVVHEAFAKVAEKWTTIRNPGAYLRRAVVNGCKNSQRKSAIATRSVRLYRQINAELPEPSDTPIFGALMRLSAKQRTSIVLKYYFDMAESDIAEAMKIPPGTVKSLVSRSLKKMRTELEDE